MSEKYRPGNGTEGLDFITEFCFQCARSDHLQPDADGETPAGCSILDATFRHEVDDAKYPTEWVRDEQGPRCTAFVPEGEPLATPRCDQTEDMFHSENVA